ncbi:helix-turn-helix transcriptional regulator [Nesterenkonia flava]|uniref:LuxR C-terminal-related transcriptional regulator n=1 Tax=Nesterenkonia flava TaxID=469799 RepID=A0ABU1FXF8_9MICC|nr:LuxR C-terminal-related transcriptional regulator [Nesterenkonia flava]MDR5712856.1 LuxR C-terminal-related transcriptional regulator [Nesterenkonia flava]
MEPVLLLVRAAHYAGWTTLVSTLRDSILSSATPVRGEFQQAIENYLDGFLACSQGRTEAAAERLLTVHRWHAAQPPLRAGQMMGDGGPFRLHKAFTALDLITLVAEHPETLHSYGNAAVEAAEWAALTFSTAGASEPMAYVRELLERLGQEEKSGSAPEDTDQEEADDAPTRAGGLDDHMLRRAGMTQRESQVALYASAGLTNREVGDQSGLSVRTVEYHTTNACESWG